MLMKLTAGVNFINILCVCFAYKSALHSFSLLKIWLCNFWQKNIGAKGACKMLMKLTTGKCKDKSMVCSRGGSLTRRRGRGK